MVWKSHWLEQLGGILTRRDTLGLTVYARRRERDFLSRRRGDRRAPIRLRN